MEDRDIRSVKDIHGNIVMDEDMHDYSTLTRLYALEYLFDSDVTLEQLEQLMIPLMEIVGTEETSVEDIIEYLREIATVATTKKSETYKLTYNIINNVYRPKVVVAPTKVTTTGFNKFGDKIKKEKKWKVKLD